MPDHLAISDYALIGNGQTATLVGSNGSIDWCCWPRFDSPAPFCRMLDNERGGYFQIAPVEPYRVRREYIGLTNILRTSFTTDGGVIELTDLMPAPADDNGEQVFPHRILRCVECTQGQVELNVIFRPTFNYARTPASFRLLHGGAVATGDDESLTLVCPVSLDCNEAQFTGRIAASAGQRFWCVVTHGAPADAAAHLTFRTEQADKEYSRTVDYWKGWIAQCRFDGPYREEVLRSALVLKLLVFQPTGGLVAAPTTSLPAEIGGERNWDYRYTWLRDSGLVLDVLQQLGYHDESRQFIDWLTEYCSDCEEESAVMYCVDGQRAPTEETLDNLSGHRESRPVRVGNGAVDQVQIDIFGHILDAVLLCFERMPREMEPRLWQFLRKLAENITRGWQVPDKGPWEIRGPAQHHVYSKLYCWVGLDRAIRFAESHDLPGDVEEWKKCRSAIRQSILERGYDPEVGAFTQAFDSDVLDSSVLTIPITGLLPVDDHRVQATIKKVEERLALGALVYRYRMDDGLAGSDETFTLASFWLATCQAMSGQIDNARSSFEEICGYANDVGLLSEQIDPKTGELLGNFPQGFTHLGLIRAALHIREAGQSVGG